MDGEKIFAFHSMFFFGKYVRSFESYFIFMYFYSFCLYFMQQNIEKKQALNCLVKIEILQQKSSAVR